MTANAKNLSTLANVLDDGTNGQFLQSTGSGGIVFADVAAGASVYDSAELLPLSGNDAGDMAYVNSTNRFYINNGSGWYSISLVNTNPNITSVQDASAGTTPFTLATDGTATVITITANDPEDVPLTYGYSVTTGSLTNGGGTTATVAQSDNVFTITPSTTEAYAGTFSLTFTASDGINTATSANSFTLEFITYVTNSRYTTLLATAVDTSDNNNITDVSSNNHTITVNGDTQAGTFSPYRNRGYSTYFEDTAANVLYASPSSDFAFGTGAFTISVWVKILHSFGGTIFDTNDGSNVGATMEISGSGFSVHSGTSYTQLASISSSNQDVWQHFCWTRDGSGNNKIFVNGTQSTTFTDSTNYTSQNFKMGERQSGTQDLKAYVKDLHIVKGYANEPDSTYADGAAEAGTGTVFLGCSLPYHGDKSSSSKTLTVASSGISIVNDTPHDYLEYAAADHGGSVQFDGSGDSLNTTATQIIPSTSFTVTAWVYLNDTTDGAVWGQGTAGHSGRTGITIDNNNWFAQIGSANLGTSTSVSANRWYYTDFQWDGSTLKFFVDGTLLGSVSNSNSPTNSAFYIGDLGSAWSTGFPLNGYVSDLKVVSGTPSGSSTVPTAPLSSSGAALHIKGTDASIIDKSQGANLKLVGNTTGSTTQVKFSNTKSMYFDGSGDHIEIDGPFNLGTQPWTWEAWIYTGDNSYTLVNIGESHSTGFSMEKVGSSYYIYDMAANTYYSASNVPANNTWTHLAFCRQSNGNHDLYKDGSRISNYTSWNSKDWGSLAKLKIGEYWNTNQSDFSGYFQDVRLTIGLSRYTANFTPPTASLKG